MTQTHHETVELPRDLVEELRDTLRDVRVLLASPEAPPHTKGYDSPMPAPAPALITEEMGALFKSYRTQLGLSQAKASALCRVDTSTVYRWEAGKQRHTHKSKDDALRAGLETMRRAWDRYGRKLTDAEYDDLLDSVRRLRRRRVA